MKLRLFLTYIVVLIPTWAMMEYGWWNAFYIGNPYSDYGNIASMRFIPIILAAFVTLMIWGIWNFEIRRTEQSKARTAKVTGQDEAAIEKRKRDRLDTVLHDLSDADLLRLRQRLNDGTINDDALEEHLIGEDGELLYQEKQR
jgi:hypothetical protein